MTPEYQAAMARLAADTKIACATSADIAKAAKARAAATAAHAAQAANVAKAKAAHAAHAAQAANVAKAQAANATKAAVKPAAKGFSYYAKAAVLTHPCYFSVAGGVIIGIVAYHLVNKFWLNKDDTAE